MNNLWNNLRFVACLSPQAAPHAHQLPSPLSGRLRFPYQLLHAVSNVPARRMLVFGGGCVRPLLFHGLHDHLRLNRNHGAHIGRSLRGHLRPSALQNDCNSKKTANLCHFVLDLLCDLSRDSVQGQSEKSRRRQHLHWAVHRGAQFCCRDCRHGAFFSRASLCCGRVVHPGVFGGGVPVSCHGFSGCLRHSALFSEGEHVEVGDEISHHARRCCGCFPYVHLPVFLLHTDGSKCIRWYFVHFHHSFFGLYELLYESSDLRHILLLVQEICQTYCYTKNTEGRLQGHRHAVKEKYT